MRQLFNRDIPERQPLCEGMMQLTRFTDLGLRVLMFLGVSQPGNIRTIAEITEKLGVAPNHTTKVVQFMGQQGWLDNIRGKGGGIRLARPVESYRLGVIVRILERKDDLIECNKPPCALDGGCALKQLLNGASDAFYAELDRHTLADAIAGSTRQTIIRLQK